MRTQILTRNLNAIVRCTVPTLLFAGCTMALALPPHSAPEGSAKTDQGAGLGAMQQAQSTSRASATQPSTENSIVYHNKKEFAGWPANEGIWSWGDEILVGFEVAAYSPINDDHSIDRNSPKRIVFARSLDGGKTWATEEKPEIMSPEYLGDRSLYDQADEAHKPRQLTQPIDFTAPNLALKLRGGTFNVSYDRGKNWGETYIFPDIGDSISEARTSYIITGPASAVFFVTVRVERNGLKYPRSCLIKTNNGGKTFEFVSWIGEDIYDTALKSADLVPQGFDHLFSIMPSAVQLQKNHFICALRQRIGGKKWTDILESTDGGKNWEKVALLEEGSSNPATLVTLQDGRIAAVYGNRRKPPMGISGKISDDGGKTWSEEITLRNDARTWDIGYSRATVRPDGKVLAIYYYTTEAVPENFIGATIWDTQTSEK